MMQKYELLQTHFHHLLPKKSKNVKQNFGEKKCLTYVLYIVAEQVQASNFFLKTLPSLITMCLKEILL